MIRRMPERIDQEDGTPQTLSLQLITLGLRRADISFVRVRDSAKHRGNRDQCVRFAPGTDGTTEASHSAAPSRN